MRLEDVEGADLGFADDVGSEVLDHVLLHETALEPHFGANGLLPEDGRCLDRSHLL